MQALETHKPGTAAQLALLGLREQVAREARWGYLLEGIRSPRMRSLVSQLLDNQTRVGIYEDDTTGDIPVFTTIALAFIPKVYPALLINQIASVQPMNGPTARVFYEDFVKDSDGTTSFTHGETSGIVTSEGAPVQKTRYKLTAQTLTAVKWALQVQWTTELQEDLVAVQTEPL
nr:hypothetical protein [Armatimonadota bacterium]